VFLGGIATTEQQQRGMLRTNSATRGVIVCGGKQWLLESQAWIKRGFWARADDERTVVFASWGWG